MTSDVSTTSEGEWLSLADAASVLGVTDRTVRRRISRGELRAMTSRTGRRLVYIRDASDCPDTGQAMIGGRPDTPNPRGILEATTAWIELARSEAIEQHRRARRTMRAAVAVMSLAVACVVVGGIWAAGVQRDRQASDARLADAQRTLSEQGAEADRMASALEESRQATLEASERASRAEGELAAYRDQPSLADVLSVWSGRVAAAGERDEQGSGPEY